MEPAAARALQERLSGRVEAHGRPHIRLVAGLDAHAAAGLTWGAPRRSSTFPASS